MKNLQSSQTVTDIEQSLRQLQMTSSAITSVKSAQNMRCPCLLSKLPKLIIPTPHEPLESFTLFPKLLVEIRMMIWKLLCTQPRKVKLFFDQTPKIFNEPRLIQGQSKHPEVLSVNRESRTEALRRFYTKCQEKVRRKPTDEIYWYNFIYINFDYDRISFNYPAELSFHESYTLSWNDFMLKKIKFIDIASLGTWEDGNLGIDYVALGYLLLQAESLVEIRAVMTCEYPDDERDILYGKESLWKNLTFHEGMEEALEDIINYSRYYLTQCRAHYRPFVVQSVRAKLRKLSAVLPGVPSRPIWDYELKDLDNSSRVETLLDF